MHTHTLHAVATVAIAGAVFPAVAPAQNYPAKAIRLNLFKSARKSRRGKVIRSARIKPE